MENGTKSCPVDPVAVVGISCRLPGNSNSPDELWDLFKDGNEAWSTVPPDRWNQGAFYHPSPDNRNGTNHHIGGHFISGDLRDFDHSFFRLSSQQADAMDPQQRILLEMSYEALENAGWPLDQLAGTKTAVHVATFTSDFERNLYKDPLDMPTYYMTGAERAIMSNRLSHAFDLRGPSMTLDTACSGGLVSLHQACLGLLDGESDAAIVAAANLILSPDHHIGMSNLHLISGTGHSYPFDQRGTGYGRGEGAVVLVVKRLDKALADRDPIRAVICGTAVNQNGHSTNGIMHPNRQAQVDLIRTAYERADINPQDVTYIEAHGTGTVAGDNEELRAIAEVFSSPGRPRSLPLYVGSNKGSIGHTESTSGLASIVKAVLILDRQVIPPVAGFKEPKTGLPLESIHIPVKPVPLPQSVNITPRVSVNSFGFGGTNAHAIMERGIQRFHETTAACCNASPRLFILSANSRESLTSLLVAYRDWLEKNPEVDLASLSYTLCCRRTKLPWRFSCVARDVESLKENIHTQLETRKPMSISASNTREIFVFTGQGAQWLGMGRELLTVRTSSVFRDSIRASRDILFKLGATWNLEEELLSKDVEHSLLNTAELAQPATTALQIALVSLLETQGVSPDVVVGHSSGEIAAAFAAGYLTHYTALAIAYYRGFLGAISRSRSTTTGSMMSVGLGQDKVAPYLNDLTRGYATIACVNSPKSVTISGDVDAIDELASRLEPTGIFFRRLPIDTAYHSDHMRLVASDYENCIRNLETTPGHGHVTFVSSVSGQIKSSGFDAAYWVTNLVSPVRFYDAIKTIGSQYLSKRSSTHLLFIEIGPHPSLAGVVRQSLETAPMPKIEYTSVLRRKIGAVSSASALAGYLYERGVNVNFAAVLDLSPGLDVASVLSSLPTYTWDHSVKHWFESRISRDYRLRREPYHDLLGVRIDSTSIEPRWRHLVDLTTLPWLADHVVDGLVVFPGSGYLCMVFEAILQLSRDLKRPLENIVVRDVAFLRAFVVPDPPKRTEMQLSFKPNGAGQFHFQFSIAILTDDKWYDHCSGTIEGVLSNGQEHVGLGNPLCIDIDPSIPLSGISFREEELYPQLEASGNKYGPLFRGCKSLQLLSNTMGALSEVEIPDVARAMPAGHQELHLIHPSTLDIIFHTSLLPVKQSLGAGSIVPVHIDELLVSGPAAMPRDPGSGMNVMASLTSSHVRKRTAYANFHVEADSTPVLSVTGMEMRSMGPTSDRISTAAKPKTMCYTLDWKADIDFIRSEDFPRPSLTKIIDHICFKYADISVMEFKSDHQDLSLTILPMIDAQGGRVSSYTCINFEPETGDPQTMHQGPIDTRVEFKTLNANENHTGEDFWQQSCTVVLLTAIKELKRACDVVESNGIVLMLLKSHEYSSKDLLGIIDQEVPDKLEVQLKFLDAVRDRLVIALRRKDTIGVRLLPKTLRILTHSPIHSNPSWVTALAARLGACVDNVTLDHINTSHVNDTHREICFLVLDDCPDPILSDTNCFGAVIELLKQPARIVWLCPDFPRMYQISGFSRTAHAENSKLQLITAHAAIEMLKDETRNFRLINFLCNRLGRLTARSDELQPEREYLIRGDGVVLVPRLHHSETLDKIVAADKAQQSEELHMCRFVDASRTLKVSSDSTVGSFDTTAAFVEDPAAGTSDLPEDDIEVETRAFGLTDDHRTTSLCEYAGVVTRVGSAESKFGPGDRVVGIGTRMGSSRPRMSQCHAIHLPANIPFTHAAELLFSVLGACYALKRLRRLTSSEHVLIHGALTPVGRAVLAVARTIGARITVLASDTVESQNVMHQLNITADQILDARISLKRRLSWSNIHRTRFDVIVQATEKGIPSEVLSQLKQFGSLIFIQTPSRLTGRFRALRNATIHAFDIVDVLRSIPNCITDLIIEVSLVFKTLSTDGLVFATRDVADVSEAVRLLDTGAHSRIVLAAEKDSMAPCILPACTTKHDWQRGDVSYVIAGGLGDLGRRMLVLLARRGARHLVTISRRVVKDDDYKDLQMQLDKICPGCRLYCLSGDITSSEDMEKAAASLAGMGVPPVGGIIQSAVILQDRTLDAMTHDEYLIASRIKVDGTLTLERTFASPHLSFIVTLSSASTIVGTSGQGNYNAGNTVQDALPHTRGDAPYSFISLNIGWIDGALATADDESRQRGLSRAGLRSIHPDELSRYLDHALGTALNEVRSSQTAIGFDAASLSHASDSSNNGNVHSAMFRHVYNTGVARSAPSASDALSFKEVASSGDCEALVELIASSITSKLTQLISADAIRIHEENRSILELGLDSLVAIELRNWITHEFCAPMQSSEIILEQTIRSLAEKIASRSQPGRATLAEQGREDETSKDLSDQSVMPPEELDHSVPPSSLQTVLPPPSLPTLGHVIRLFQDSRIAVDTDTEQTSLANAISSFMNGRGPALQQQLEVAAPELIAENYERQIYLERREPLQDYSTFSIVHPVDAPTHTQAMRAALVTIAGLTFIQNLTANRPCGIDARGEALDWMFYTVRQPGIGVDRMARFPANETVAILRRGHVFQLMLGGAAGPLSVSAMHKAYSAIIDISKGLREPVCALTADERNSWALLRGDLARDPVNSTILSAVEEAAFVVCLDDESPSTAEERHTQYLHNGVDRPFSNRWLDKPVQFVVTANGLSAGIHEHTKLDGLDVGSLHRHIVKTLILSSRHDDGEVTRLPLDDETLQTPPYPIRELIWTPGTAVEQRIRHLQTNFASPASPYRALGYEHIKCPGLGRAALRGRGASPNSIAHLTAVLAVFLVDGFVRPAWEVVSLGHFAGSRIDWVQTMSPAMREFVETAACINIEENDENTQSRLRLLLHAAARSYSRTVATAMQGSGYVNHLYSLRGLAQESEMGDLPVLFQTKAWDATRRGGTGQDLKIGFMPSEEEKGNDNVLYREGGFLMNGDRGVYVHCDVSEDLANFYVSARRQYASDVCLALQTASSMVSHLLK